MAQKRKKNAKNKNTKNKPIKNEKHTEIKYYVLAIFSIVFIIITLLSLGIIGESVKDVISLVFGSVTCYLLLIQLLFYFGYMLYEGSPLKFKSRYVAGSIFFIVGLMVLITALSSEYVGFKIFEDDMSKLGYIPSLLFGLTSQLFSEVGALLLSIAFLVVGIVIYTMLSVNMYLKKTVQYVSEKQQDFKQSAANINWPKRKVKNVIVDENLFDDLESEIVIEENDNNFIEDNNEVSSFDHNQMDNLNDKIDFDNVVSNDDLPFDDEDLFNEIEGNEIIDNENVLDLDQEIEIKKVIKSTLEKVKPYKLPSFDLLNNPKVSDANEVNKRNADKKAELLKSFLKDFNLDVNITNINIGPSITKFELTLQPGVRVNKIASMYDDIKMALAAREMRIEAPIPGQSAVGIEIPNVKNLIITLKEVLNDINFNKENKLVFGLGKDINGKSIYTSLNKMPHLLVAGSTGSGKSVCINSIIISILMNAHYDEVKLLLIDPKKVELNMYNDIPHLLSPVVTDPKHASIALRKVVEEMDTRYQTFANTSCKNIEGYNNYVKEHNKKQPKDLHLETLPYIVVIIDELADLMMVSAKDVEECIMRITQMARAAGIHLIVATQRPSTDVITGVIKANIPSRIAFAVSSSIDSRTILDMVGAEKLLGKGDMLFSPSGTSSPIRLQGAFLSDEEVLAVVKEIKRQNIKVIENDTFASFEPSNLESRSSEDEIYDDVKEYVTKQERISTSQVQRFFKIGYNRAARLIDDLEANGVISAANGSKPREVLEKNGELE